jgi:hypothetical protein
MRACGSSAVVTAEDGRVELGARCVVMGNALLRGPRRPPARIGDDVLVRPARAPRRHGRRERVVPRHGQLAVPRLAAASRRRGARINGVVHVDSPRGGRRGSGWSARRRGSPLIATTRHVAG